MMLLHCLTCISAKDGGDSILLSPPGGRHFMLIVLFIISSWN